MRPVELTLCNFQSFQGEHKIPLGLIRCAVLIGFNGAGKSSIFDAIRFCLWGFCRVPRDLNWVITQGEQVCRVEFEFALGEDRYLVSRQRSSKGSGSTTLAFHRLTADGPQVLDGKTATETQARIVETLHMTDEIFRISACGSQRDEMQFTDVMPGKRREILGGIVIPDPLVWEKRADRARAMQRDLEATRGANATAAGQAEAIASIQYGDAPIDLIRTYLPDRKLPDIALGLIPRALLIEAQIAEVARRLEDLDTVSNSLVHDIDGVQTEREEMVGAREADRAKRAELMGLRKRAEELGPAARQAQARVEALEQAVAGKAKQVATVEAAEAAAIEAQTLEAGRQEKERLAGEGRLFVERIKGAKGEHAAAVQKLSSQVEAAQKEHSLGLVARRDNIAGLAKQAEVLDSVPCIKTEDELLSKACPLIAQAREARDALPGARLEIARFGEQMPWADNQERLAKLRGEQPWAADARRSAQLRAEWEAVEYDKGAHEEARRRAGGLAELQRRVAQMEAAEAQLPEARAAQQRTGRDFEETAGRARALAEQLGPERDWQQELGALDRRAAQVREEHAQARREIETLQEQRGRLGEQMAGAKRAAEEAKRLAAEIAEADRRINLLKILGSQQSGAFSKAGIPALLVEQAIPELEEAANEILRMLSDGRLSVELRSQRENKDRSIAEALDIIVYGEQGPRPYESFSGGEAVRVALAMRGGVSTLLSRRTGARCELLILDEPRWLDGPGQDELAECLARLSDRFATILLATHIERLKDLFPQRLEVSRGADGSRVEVIGL